MNQYVVVFEYDDDEPTVIGPFQTIEQARSCIKNETEDYDADNAYVVELLRP